MMTHTKGPWKATRNESFSYSIGTDYIHDRGHDCNIVREVRCEANAFLIAAAPELLELLQIYVDRCPMCSAGVECQENFCYNARKLIRKAKEGQ